MKHPNEFMKLTVAFAVLTTTMFVLFRAHYDSKAKRNCVNPVENTALNQR